MTRGLRGLRKSEVMRAPASAFPVTWAATASAIVGTVTFGRAPGEHGLYSAGNPFDPNGDWYGPLPGSEIALGHENLQVDFATPVTAIGFVFVESCTLPPYGGTGADGARPWGGAARGTR